MAEQEKRVSFLTVLGDGILMLCALAGLIGSFLSLYGSAEQGAVSPFRATPLDLCAAQAGNFFALALIFTLISLAAWSLPRFRWAAVGGASLLLGLLAYSNWDGAVRGAGLTLHTITSLFAQRVSWGWVFPHSPGLTPPQSGAAARLFLTLALMLLALMLGWAVVRARRWWIVLLLTLPPLLPGLLADLYPDWFPFMALSACWCAMLLTDLCKWAAPRNRGKLTLAVLPCVAAALAVITLMLPREGYTRPQWALRAEARLYHGADILAGFLARWDGPFKRTVTYVGSAEEADLAHAGPLNYTGRTVLRVRSDYDGRLYLRGSSLAVYEDGRWTALPDAAYQESSFSTGLSGSPPVRPLFFPAMSTTHGPEHTVTVDNVGAVGSCVYAPYFLTVQELEENGMSMINDSLLARQQGRWTHTLSFVELYPDTGLEGLIQAITHSTVLYVGEAGVNFGSYPSFVYEHYLDVPEDMNELLTRFCAVNGIYGAALDGGAADPVDTARRIAALLDQYYEYDQSVEAPPEGTDPVAWFLLDSQRGYCMHFASAAALMLRSLGIPARYVSGFTAQCAPGRNIAVPDRAAHAWVEVWVRGFGWYPVEVTPAAAFTWYESGSIGLDELPSDFFEESEEPEPTPTPTPAQTPEPSEKPSEGPVQVDEPEPGPDLAALFPILRVLGAAAGIAAALWLGQRLPKQFRAKRLKSPDRNRAALDGYGYLVRMARWGGRVDERAVELAQKAKFSQHTLTREELDELRVLVDRERERLCVILGPAARLAFRYFWGMPKLGGESGKFRRKRGLSP